MSTHPVALVTGGSRGIGRGICLELSRRGYAVMINYAGNEAAARETERLIAADSGQLSGVRSQGSGVRKDRGVRSQGSGVRKDRDSSQLTTDQGPRTTVPTMLCQADVAVATDRDRMVDELIRQWGRIDLLVNNAGITSVGRRDVLDATEESWDRVLGVNLKGPFFLTQRVAREMVRVLHDRPLYHPCIINISSLSAYAVSTNRGDYCISKAAMSMLTKVWAVRLAEHGIRVFEVRPGVVDTDMTAGAKEKYDRLIAEGLSPIRRWGTAEDVGKAVAALASGDFPFTTGDALNVDGGFHLRRL